jgi:hypothetical protein
MRQSCRRRAHRVAQLLALLALLANAALLPVLHFAAGGPGAALSPTPHAEGVHHDAHENGGGNEPSGASHQVCHFCRAVGAALPPPPSAILAFVPESYALSWPIADRPIRPRDHFHTAHRPRAPPLKV